MGDGRGVSQLTPSLPQAVQFPGKRCTDALVKSIFSGPTTHLLSILMKLLSHVSAKKKTKRLKGFKFRTFIGRFQVTTDSEAVNES